MITPVSDVLGLGISWLIVPMAAAGSCFTWRRTKRQRLFWVTLTLGWTLLAISNTIAVLGLAQGASLSAGLALTAYVLVMTSLTLLFLWLTRMLESSKAEALDSEPRRCSTNG